MLRLKKGDRVQASGKGRTAKWGRKFIGTVTRRRGKSVFVHWDNTSFEDQMHESEVKRELSN